jgi:hypothetical protein
MSTTGIKLLCETVLGFDSQNQPAYLTEYKCSLPVQTPSGPHFGAGIVTLLDGLTETPFNALVAQAIADKANLETSNVENFTSDDVFGGRI